MTATTAVWIIVAVVLVAAVAAVIAWRVRAARALRDTGAGELVRECSNCGHYLPTGAIACPTCGSDMSMFIA